MNISLKRSCSRSPGQRFARRRANLVRVARLLGATLIMSLVLPALMTVFAGSAFAAEDEAKDYSLYKLASNASAYFSKMNSPENESGGLHANWSELSKSAATGGNMLGFADKDASVLDAVGWLFTGETATTQLISYETLRTAGDYEGMMGYAHFGAVSNSLGLDSMSSGDIGKMISGIGGGIIWLAYALALTVSMLFFFIIELLKLLNPFAWFSDAVLKTTNVDAHEKALSMTGGVDTPLTGIQGWITQWYTQIHTMSWAVLVPLFLGFLIIGLILFKKMDRGSAIKKFIVRLLFIGLGLPLMGSLYTGVLTTFGDSLVGQHAGPTRVVLSTYVDFEKWMINDRLKVPSGAAIGWDNTTSSASDDSMMAVRKTALAINKQSHLEAFKDIRDVGDTSTAQKAWESSMQGIDGKTTSGINDFKAILTTFGIIQKYMIGEKAAASDFESGIKSSITKITKPAMSPNDKKKWFVGERGYGDVDGFGEEGDVSPVAHPLLSVGSKEGGQQGLRVDTSDRVTKFTTASGASPKCGVGVAEAPRGCNLSALSAYNYLNTRFDSQSMTVFSSDKVMSGLTREDHMAVSQVGTGPAKFMYWSNAVTVLGSLVLLGFWYAIGMLAGAIKRTVGLVTAIPFATLGAMGAISKVIIYTVALVSEVLVTLFIYQFVSQLLISIPDIIAGPVSTLVNSAGIGGGTLVVVMTLVSSLLIIGVTFALMRVRKVVLQAMDEVFTKLVDKFLDTNTAPKPDKAGMLPALAAGAGAGAGMALGNRMASKLGSKSPTTPGTKTGGPKQSTGTTNAGGLNKPAGELGTGKATAALEPGQADGTPAAGTPGGPQGPEGPEGSPGGGGRLALPGERESGPQGPKGGSVGTGGTANADRSMAEGLSRNGGLSNLGYDLSDKSRGGMGGTAGTGPASGRRGRFGGSGGTAGTPGTANSGPRSGSRSAGSASLGGTADASRTRASNSPRVAGTGNGGRGVFEVGQNGVASPQSRPAPAAPVAPAISPAPQSGRRANTPGSQPVQSNPTPEAPRRRRLGERSTPRSSAPTTRRPRQSPKRPGSS